MDAQEILLALRGQDDEPADRVAKSIQDLLANSTVAEQAAVIATLRRGATWAQAREWLERARFESASMDDAVYERALGLYGGSTLLDWKECVDVAPAMVYRPSWPRRA